MDHRTKISINLPSIQESMCESQRGWDDPHTGAERVRVGCGAPIAHDLAAHPGGPSAGPQCAQGRALDAADARQSLADLRATRLSFCDALIISASLAGRLPDAAFGRRAAQPGHRGSIDDPQPFPGATKGSGTPGLSAGATGASTCQAPRALGLSDPGQRMPHQQRRQHAHGQADQAVQHAPGHGPGKPRGQPAGAEAQHRKPCQAGPCRPCD